MCYQLSRPTHGNVHPVKPVRKCGVRRPKVLKKQPRVLSRILSNASTSLEMAKSIGQIVL